MILSGKSIHEQLGQKIRIEPFRAEQLNPNSYNLRLHHELLVYDQPTLDMKRENTAHRLTIPEEGLLMEKDKLYLGRTIEYTETHGYVPMLEGRSSVGRLGFVRAHHRWFWRRGFRRLLDAGDVLRAAGAHLCWGANMPNILSQH